MFDSNSFFLPQQLKQVNYFTRLLTLLTLLSLLLIEYNLALAKISSIVDKANDVHSLAGWVEIANDVAPYVVVRVVEGNSNTVIRTSLLDATHAFSFISLPTTVNAVQAMVQLPWRDWEIDFDHSILSVPIDLLGGNNVHLKVTIKPIIDNSEIAFGTADENTVINSILLNSWNSSAHHASDSNIAAAILTLVLLLSAWFGRHWLVGMLDVSNIKPPKPKRLVVQR